MEKQRLPVSIMPTVTVHALVSTATGELYSIQEAFAEVRGSISSKVFVLSSSSSKAFVLRSSSKVVALMTSSGSK